MNPGQKSNAKAPIDLKKKWTGEMQGEVDVALRDLLWFAPRSTS